MKRLAKLLEPGFIPFVLAFAFAIFTITYSALGLPSPHELATKGKALYEAYGLWVLLGAALLEGVFMVNIYIPGSFVIVLSVFLSDKSIPALTAIALVTWMGFFSSSIFNYFLGSTGLYRLFLLLGKQHTVQNMEKWMEKKGKGAIFLSSLHPNFQAFSMVCAGISRYSFMKTATQAAIGLAFWVPIWTIFFAIVLKKVDIESSNNSWYLVLLLVVMGLALCVYEHFKKKQG